MSATPIPAATRFFAPEITKVIYVPTIAATDGVPTRAEINAGDDLSNEIADLSGWTVQSGFIDTPDLGRRYTRKIGGRLTTPDSSLTMYADKAGEDVREVLPRGTEGAIVFMDGGDVPGQPMDVFVIEVASNSQVRGTGDNAAQRMVQFSISDFVENATIPAATP